ncbi:hypothetical protein BU24DRAFT_51943 [Aaosphaeria arxii CBS 175.79]|uniref:Uncharacterized protein n=1 Tax=Aaosphaeria arxii CBS 175.79 TaxID=1450172 RepID=A0A6A5XE08_9PLEO|nr:uncharacterized protein BU24DRAFT_51943 [Aaosphaeria arxii CBS 175.79]KAF2011047.1 hypothetical protein BU24DRAFT_51943 [Aaosphaeria arxii CBS 175.79]
MLGLNHPLAGLMQDHSFDLWTSPVEPRSPMTHTYPYSYNKPTLSTPSSTEYTLQRHHSGTSNLRTRTSKCFHVVPTDQFCHAVVTLVSSGFSSTPLLLTRKMANSPFSPLHWSSLTRCAGTAVKANPIIFFPFEFCTFNSNSIGRTCVTLLLVPGDGAITRTKNPFQQPSPGTLPRRCFCPSRYLHCFVLPDCPPKNLINPSMPLCAL